MEMSREEAERNVDERERAFTAAFAAIRIAKADAKTRGLKRGNGGAGELPCPAQCGGTLHYTVAAYNGHMHAACSTKGCGSWME